MSLLSFVSFLTQIIKKMSENMYNMLEVNANIEINDKIFCYFQCPKSMSDFLLNALALSWQV